MNKLKNFAAAAVILLLMTGLICYSAEVGGAVFAAIDRCCRIIIPSLFAFMAFSRLLIGTGLAGLISRPFNRLFRIVPGIPEGGAALFIISNTAGYPVGAAALSDMVQRGQVSKRTAEIMSIYCCAGGPAFMINAIGVSVFGSFGVGLCVFLAVLSANTVLAAVVNRLYRPDKITPVKTENSISEELIGSVTGAGEAVLKMCAVIVFFSAVMAAAEAAGLFSMLSELPELSEGGKALLRSVFEITNAAQIPQNSYKSIPLLAAICSFGGISVLMQIKCAAGNSISLNKLYKWLPVKGALTFGFTKLYLPLLSDDSIPTFSRSPEIIGNLDNLLPSLCLIMMIFILILQKRLDFFHHM
ncbi:MAG: hypothetical protein IKN17_08310 [Ruminococcus sp.]|nr:hypothetical protein [Ruminococcus sp.]